MKKFSFAALLMALLLLLAACGQDADLPQVETPDISSTAYSHISNGGAYDGNDFADKSETERYPYGVDAITCATLTIEGPAMKSSVPLAVGSMEGHQDILARGIYKDKAGTFSYEGADVWKLLNLLGESEGIIPTDKAYKVVIKNSNRAEIASFTMAEVKQASEDGRPIMLAYGIAKKDGSSAAPFVFDGKDASTHTEGYVDSLKNDDGCLKLVYDTKKYGSNSYDTFANAAYVYVCEESEPGYKHSTGNGAYADPSLTDYVVTFRGSTLGYEIDLSVAQLEALVNYDQDGNVAEGGIGYRDSYSLANNTYWYVNEYEGLKLYDLLCYLGMPNYDEMGTKAARTTLVSFLTSDGILSSEKFSVDALSYPDAFGFYNKNAADNNDGTYESTNEDLVKTGYPVLMAYGFNKYPYVVSKKDDGFLSGLSNSGGPFRVVFGKMNYSHANGSNQVQYLSDVIVGDDVYYSTHKYCGNDAVEELAKQPLPLRLYAAGSESGSLKEFTLGDLEDLVYGDKVAPKDKKMAQVKTVVDGAVFEGVDLAYLISDVLKVPYADDETKISGSFNIFFGDESVKLSDVKAGKYVLAFAKNGAPLVRDDMISEGYVKERALKPVSSTDPAVYPVENYGGPVCLIEIKDDGSAEYDYSVQGIDVTIDQTAAQLEDLRKQAEEEAIARENAVPNADIAWNHSMSPEYAKLLNSEFTVTISNTGHEWTHTFTLEELEKYTDCVVREKYSTVEIGWAEGLGLWKFVKQICGYDPLQDGYVPASGSGALLTAASPVPGLSEAESVTISAPDGYQIDLVSFFLLKGVENGTKSDDGKMLPILLCYGQQGYANVATSNDDGYVEEIDNAYGPLRIIVEKSSQASMKQCVKLDIKVPGDGELPF